MSIKQTHICDGCEKEILHNHRLKISIEGLPTCDDIHSPACNIIAVKDACSRSCALQIITALITATADEKQWLDNTNPPSPRSIDEYEFSVRTCLWLQRRKIATIEDLAVFSYNDLSRLERPSKRMFLEIDEALKKYGFARRT